MERFNYRTGEEEDTEAITLVLDLAEAPERVGLPVVRAWATQFDLPGKILRVLRGFFEHQRRVFFLKDAQRSSSRLCRLFSLGQSGVACSYAMCCSQSGAACSYAMCCKTR